MSRSARRPRRPAPSRRLPPRGAAVDRRIYRRIHDAILEHRLPPGTKLGEEALSAVFGASRARVRRVLLRLAHDQAIELYENRGAWVAKPSVREADEVFAARRVIEGHLVQAAAKSLTPAQTRRLERHVAREARADRRGDRRAAIRLSGEFHLLLAHVAGSAVLERFLRELIARTSLIIALYEGPGSSCCAFEEHRTLLAEVAAGRAQAAADVMLRHLDGVQSRLDLDRHRPRSVDLRTALAPD